MVYVEFFDDKELLDNICSCFVRIPEKIYFIGNDKDKMEKHIKRYKKVLSDRGAEVEMIPIPVNRNSMSALIGRMTEIVEAEDECIFDLTGGDDLCLVAMGVIFERYRESKNIQMHRFNLRSNRVYDCDEDGQVLYEKDMPKMSIAENISVFGGEIIYDDEKENATHRWDMNDDFIDDIDIMWHICSTNANKAPTRKWDRQIMIFEKLESIGGCDGSLTSTASLAEIRKFFETDGAEKNRSFYINKRIISELKKYRLIDFTENEDELRITYKNEQVKRCLTKAGMALEMKIYLLSLFVEKDGERVYDDVLHGVSIDWDTKSDSETDVKNEIDVIAMHRMIPVFISCKNGDVKMDELYKLDSVATRFGGKYSRKVMVVSDLKLNQNEMYIRHRADEMGIEIVDTIELGNEKLEKRLGNIWAS